MKASTVVLTAIPWVAMLLAVFTLGTVNATFDGFLTWIIGLYLFIVTVIGLVMTFIGLIMEILDDTEDDIRSGKFTELGKAYKGWRGAFNIFTMVCFVSGFIYLEWGGFLGWYLTNCALVFISSRIVMANVKRLSEKWGIETGDQPEEIDDLAEFR